MSNPVTTEVGYEVEFRPRSWYRYAPAWLQRVLARFGLHVYDEIKHPYIDLVQFVPPAGETVVVMYTINGQD